jgi:ribonuclease E
MKKEMLINVLQPEECRIAIVEDGVLEELYVERTSHESYTGNIYKGKIVNLEPAIQAAFVDFSVGRNGFLHVSDIESQYFDRAPTGPADTEPPPREREREHRKVGAREARREAARRNGGKPRER